MQAVSIQTYEELQTAIANWLEDDNLSARIPEFITLAEARFNRELRIRDMIARTQSSATSRYLSLPSDFLQMRMMRLLTDPITVLGELNHHEMNRFRQEGSGKPKFFTVHEEIEFDRAPDTTRTVEMIYYKQIDVLSDSNVSNAILDRAPDLYLYGSLVATAPFLMHDERLSTWESMYQQVLTMLNGLDRHRSGPLNIRPATSTP